MSSESMSSPLSYRDKDIRKRLIQAKAARGIDSTEPPCMGGPDPHYFPPHEATQALMEIYNATAAGDLDTVKRLVEDEHYHPTPNYRSQALVKAIESKQIKITDYLLSHSAEINGMVVVAASRATDLSMFQLMVKSGWNVNAPMFGGRTMLASILESPALVTWFVHHSADPNLGPPQMGPTLEATPMPNSGVCLYEAAASSTIEVVMLLIGAGAKPENSTPLHAAVRRGTDAIPMLRFLLRLSGIHINGLADLCDQFSMGTPLESVIKHGVRSESVTIANFLLENGADPHPDERPGIDVFDGSVRLQLEEFCRRGRSWREAIPEKQQSSVKKSVMTQA